MQDLSRAQQNYFRESSIRNENGDLTVVYNRVKAIDTETLEYQPTCYTDPSYLDLDGGYTAVPMYVNAKNPFEYKGKTELANFYYDNECTSYRDMVNKIKEQGYDAIVSTNNAGVKEITIFEPNQIKAVGNRFPTKSDYSLDNSAEYQRINSRNMTIQEHLEIAKLAKMRGGSLQPKTSQTERKRNEQER
jgi:hypothetical protein